MEETEQQKQAAEDKRKITLLKELSAMEAFHIWRDWVAQPVLESLEADLNNADQLEESVLRAKLKHVQFVRELFYDMFKKL